MTRTKHTDAPGSPAWHARRSICFNAGDASAMLSCHPSGKTRSQLLHELHTGLQREFSDYVQERVIDPGHRVEALWRGIAEEIVGEDLQVLAYSLEVAGLSRPLGASLDAVTFMEDTLGECKSANEALRAALPHEGRDSHQRNDARQLPKGYRVQCEQQQLVTGAQRTLFSACRFNADGTVAEERHCWYSSDPELRAEILAGWRQFDADLAAYVPPAASAVEKIVAEPVEALPAVVVKVEGSIVVHENFDVFEKAVRHFLEHRLIRAPKTDQDFADLEQQIKGMKLARESIKAGKAHALAQVQPVDRFNKAADMLDALLQQNQSLSERLLKDEKERRRGDIVAGGVKGLADHIAALNHRLGKPYMPAVPADFGGAIRGLKSLASMEDKVGAELARAKAAATEIASRIQENLQALAGAADKAFLFADERQLVLKAPDDCKAAIAARIAEHERKEAARLEAERARIRQEEEARAAEAAREKNEMALQEIMAIQQQVYIATLGRAGVRKGGTIECIRETLAETEGWVIDHRFGALQGAAQAAKDKAVTGIRQLLTEAEAREQRQREEDAARAEQQRQAVPTGVAGGGVAGEGDDAVRITVTSSAPSPAVIPMPNRAPAAPAVPTLRLGEIKRRIAPLQIDAAGLDQLGFKAAGREGSAVLFHEADFPQMVEAMRGLLASALRKQLEAA